MESGWGKKTEIAAPDQCGRGDLAAVRAVRFVRKMRGGTRALLFECDDGAFYVVKSSNNPQHRRTLPNEWVASRIMDYLQIATPGIAAVELSSDFLQGLQKQGIDPFWCSGWHFGSKYPGHPDRVAVYDFLPDQLLAKVHNVREFLGTMVFDKWLGNADARQCIFFRAPLTQWIKDFKGDPRTKGFVALMIDNGYIFNGHHWEFINSPAQGLYHRVLVYNTVQRLEDFQPWLGRVISFPASILEELTRNMPAEWLQGDEASFSKLLERLAARQKRVPDLLFDTLRGFAERRASEAG